MAKRLNLIGERFGRAVVVEYVPVGKQKCLCDCGNVFITRTNRLTKGITKSCGCFRRDHQSHQARTHGFRNTRIYHTWRSMKDRCYNPNTESFKNYGNRGITVCDEWRNDFLAFYTWSMSHGYSDDLTIDRIDVNGNYEPSNCRWVNQFVQANNKRNTRYLVYRGERKSLAEWSRSTGFSRGLIADRVFRHGWSVEQALTLPKSQGKRVKK
jgi:hypothetical protein